MYSNYECIGITFTEEDLELKKKLLECCFRRHSVYKQFIDVFEGLWWRKDLKSLKIIDNQMSYLVVNDIRCYRDRLYNLLQLSNVLFPRTTLYYETCHMITMRIFYDYPKDGDYIETEIYYDYQGKVENKETFKELLSQYGNEDELYDRGHREEGKFYRAFLNFEKREECTIEYWTNEAVDTGGGSNGMDTDVGNIEVKPMEQKVLERDFFSKIIDESIKKGFEDFTALLLDKCRV